MIQSIFRRFLLAAFALSIGVSIVGCGKNPDGKYATADGAATLELKSGKGTLGMGMGSSEPFDYTVDGDKVTLKSKSAPDANIVLTIESDGSLRGPNGVFKRAK